MKNSSDLDEQIWLRVMTDHLVIIKLCTKNANLISFHYKDKAKTKVEWKGQHRQTFYLRFWLCS